MSVTSTILEPARPDTIHSCPSCSHWLPEGTLACPDCQTLTYGQHLGQLAADAQMLEQQEKWTEARVRWASALQWLPEGTRQAAGVQQHITAIDQRLQAQDDRKARWTKRLGPLAPVVFFLLKAKSFLFVALKLKFLVGLFTFVALYWALFGWGFALGFTSCLAVHEMGHFVAVKRRGLKADLPMFIPGFGAYVRWYGMGVSREDLASISLAGPLFGLAASLACWGLYRVTHMELLLVLANVGAWLNLLNLIPVFGLDGAQAALALTRLQRGLVAATAAIFFAVTSARHPFDFDNPSNHYIALVLAALMGWQCFSANAPEEPNSSTLFSFLSILLVLGLVLHVTGVSIAQIPHLALGEITH